MIISTIRDIIFLVNKILKQKNEVKNYEPRERPPRGQPRAAQSKRKANITRAVEKGHCL